MRVTAGDSSLLLLCPCDVRLSSANELPYVLVQNLSGLLNSDVMMGDSPRGPYKNVAEGSGTLYGGHDVIIDDEDLVAYGSGSGSGSGDGAGVDDREPTPKSDGECRWCCCVLIVMCG